MSINVMVYQTETANEDSKSNQIDAFEKLDGNFNYFYYICFILYGLFAISIINSSAEAALIMNFISKTCVLALNVAKEKIASLMKTRPYANALKHAKFLKIVDKKFAHKETRLLSLIVI
jgi:hypothetical protein